jgi:hypothetical protein
MGSPPFVYFLVMGVEASIFLIALDSFWRSPSMAFAPPFAAIVSRSPTSAARPHRRTSAMTGTSPAHDTRFGSFLTVNRGSADAHAPAPGFDSLRIDKTATVLAMRLAAARRRRAPVQHAKLCRYFSNSDRAEHVAKEEDDADDLVRRRHSEG